MAQKCYPGKKDYVDTVLKVTKTLFENVNLERIEYATPVGRELERLLRVPVEGLNDAVAVLAELPGFTPLAGSFDFAGRRAVARLIAENMVENCTVADTVERAEAVLACVAALTADQADGPAADNGGFDQDPEEFSEEQSKTIKNNSQH